MPQMPVPFTTIADGKQHHHGDREATPKPMNQPVEVGRVSTIELILSVTDPGVPGSMTGPSVFGCFSVICRI
jgi:hypothetical protein